MFIKNQSFLLGAAVAALLLSATAPRAHAQVWEATNSWSQEWENRYSEWVRTQWDQNFFNRPGTPYTGLVLDCADAVYSMRIIYSYENRLPFAMKDPTGGSKPISNSMSRFDDLDPQSRIRAFLKFIYETGSTSSLPDDSYPLAVSRSTIRSGAIIVTTHESHHSWTVKEILPIGIPHLIFATRPAATTLLVRIGQPSMEFTFHTSFNPEAKGGYRAFRHPEDIGKPQSQVPGYSEEQYQIPYKLWMETIKRRLSLVNESPESLLRRTLDTACGGARERVASVDAALAYLSKIGDRCLDAKEFDDYSTPNRDLRTRNDFEALQEAYESVHSNSELWNQLPSSLAAQVQDVFTVSNSPEDSRTCPVTLAPGRVLSLHEIMKRSLGDRLSWNPHDPLEYRWGDKQGHSARALSCPTYE